MEVGGVSLIFDRQNFPELLFPPQFSRSARAVNTGGSIEVPLLHPTLSLLFSSTHSRRLKNSSLVLFLNLS